MVECGIAYGGKLSKDAEERAAMAREMIGVLSDPEYAGRLTPSQRKAAIDDLERSVVEKTIIMIRKYRRLHDGRHEFGSRLKEQPAR